MLKNIFKQHREYDGTLEFIAKENNFESIWVDTTDCDGVTTTIRLPFDKVKELQSALDDWLNQEQK